MVHMSIIRLIRKCVCMVYFLLADGFEEAEAIVPFDMLRRANIDVKLASAGKTLNVCCKHSINFACDLYIDNIVLNKGDMIVLPGGIPGVPNLDNCAGLDSLLCDAVNLGSYIAAICAAPTLLGKRGLLKGKKAVCYPGMEGELVGAEICDEKVVSDGNIITSRAAGTATDFGLELVKILAGENVSEKIRASICY